MMLRNVLPILGAIIVIMIVGAAYGFALHAAPSTALTTLGTPPSPMPPAPQTYCYNSAYVNDIYTAGTTTLRYGNNQFAYWADRCNPTDASGRTVLKGYCENAPAGTQNYNINQRSYVCPLGCVNGACVRSTSTLAAAPAGQVTFSYPYPVIWTENGVEFDLTGANYSPTVPASVNKSSAQSGAAITLIFKGVNITDALSPCTQLNVRRLFNEEGNFVAYDALKSPGCQFAAGITHPDIEATFIVDPSLRQFTFNTGVTSNLNFSVKIASDGTISIINISAQKQG